MKKSRFLVKVLAIAIIAGLNFSCSTYNGYIKDITSLKSYDGTIKDKKKHVMMVFFTTSNTPCNMIAPNLNVIAEEMADKLVVAGVNTDMPFVAKEHLTQRWRVEDMPCMILYEDGLEIARNVGYMTKEELRTWLNKYIK